MGVYKNWVMERPIEAMSSLLFMGEKRLSLILGVVTSEDPG